MDEQFDEINQQLKLKKEAFIEMYRQDPRISHDEAVMNLRNRIQHFDPLNPHEIPALETVENIEEPKENETLALDEKKGNAVNQSVIYCNTFSDDNHEVIVTDCKRRIKYYKKDDSGIGYCFLSHPKLEADQVLQWTVRMPKFHYCCEIGMVIILEKIIFYFLDITF